AVREAVRSGGLSSAHDIAEGGLAVALAECCAAGGIGAGVTVPEGLDPFGEAPGRAYVVSGPEAQVSRLGPLIGRVGGPALQIDGLLTVAVSALVQARDGGLRGLV